MDSIASTLFSALAAAKAALDEANDAYEQSRRVRNTLNSLELVVFMIPRDERSRTVIAKVLSSSSSASAATSASAKEPRLKKNREPRNSLLRFRLRRQQQTTAAPAANTSTALPATMKDDGQSEMVQRVPKKSQIAPEPKAADRPAEMLKQYIAQNNETLSQLQTTMFGLECTVQLIVELLASISETLRQIRQPRLAWLFCTPWKIRKQNALKGEMDDHEVALKDHISILQSAISVASFCVQKESLESTFDSSSEMTNQELRMFWRRKIGRDKARVSKEEFGECVFEHAFHPTDHDANCGGEGEGEDGRGSESDAGCASRVAGLADHASDPCILLRRLAALYVTSSAERGWSDGGSDTISVFDLQQKFKDTRSGTSVFRTMLEWIAEQSLSFHRGYEYALCSESSIAQSFMSMGAGGDGGGLRRWRVNRHEPLMAVFNLWWSSAFGSTAELDAVCLVRFDLKPADAEHVFAAGFDHVEWDSIPVKPCADFPLHPISRFHKSFEVDDAHAQEVFDMRLGSFARFSIKNTGFYALRLAMRSGRNPNVVSYVGKCGIIEVVDEPWLSVVLDDRHISKLADSMLSSEASALSEDYLCATSLKVYDISQSTASSSSSSSSSVGTAANSSVGTSIRCDDLQQPMRVSVRAYVPMTYRKVFRHCKFLQDQSHIAKFWPPSTLEEIDLLARNACVVDPSTGVVDMTFSFSVAFGNGKSALGHIMKYYFQLTRDENDKRYQYITVPAPKIAVLLDCTVPLPAKLVVRDGLEDEQDCLAENEKACVQICNEAVNGSLLRTRSSVRYLSSQPTTIRGDLPVPKSIGLYFFEATVDLAPAQASTTNKLPLFIGLVSSDVDCESLPGWDGFSLSYSVSDGAYLSGYDSENNYSLSGWPKAENGDCIGVALDRGERKVLFTLNGFLMGVKDLFPLHASLERSPSDVDWFPAFGSNVAHAQWTLQWPGAKDIGKTLNISNERFLQLHPAFDPARSRYRQRSGMWHVTVSQSGAQDFVFHVILHFDPSGNFSSKQQRESPEIEGSLLADAQGFEVYYCQSDANTFSLRGVAEEDEDGMKIVCVNSERGVSVTFEKRWCLTVA
eukprot:ANDGO_04345.mRNA.1 hypothetical protein